ncbi:MAG: thiamine pyrophosphate-dependent enzyme [Nitratireductor sp.]
MPRPNGGKRFDRWKARNWPCLQAIALMIMPQYAIERLYELTKDRKTYITTEVGQHQMWAAQFLPLRGAEPLDDIGGLGTMGVMACQQHRVQIAHPDALVIDIAGDASIQMCIQENVGGGAV